VPPGAVAYTPLSHGGRSSARLERQVVALEVGGSSPLAHPIRPAGGRPTTRAAAVRSATGTPARRHHRCAAVRSTGPTLVPPCASSSMAEQRTLNPQVLGSNPRGRTTDSDVGRGSPALVASGERQPRPPSARSAQPDADDDEVETSLAAVTPRRRGGRPRRQGGRGGRRRGGPPSAQRLDPSYPAREAQTRATVCELRGFSPQLDVARSTRAFRDDLACLPTQRGGSGAQATSTGSDS
jgi:hypothetical protein